MLHFLRMQVLKVIGGVALGAWVLLMAAGTFAWVLADGVALTRDAGGWGLALFVGFPLVLLALVLWDSR